MCDFNVMILTLKKKRKSPIRSRR